MVSSIGKGFFILVGVENGDTESDMEWLAQKTIGMRIFDDENGVMNLNVTSVDGSLLAVSQFKLTASTKKGNRPSYIRAAGHDLAVPLYENTAPDWQKSPAALSRKVFSALTCNAP